jgi:hypothetical protein
MAYKGGRWVIHKTNNWAAARIPKRHQDIQWSYCCATMLQRRTADEVLRLLGDTVVSSYLRFAAGVFLLSTGLFLGATGGATAVADTDSGGSTADGDGGAGGSSQDGSTASSPAGSTATDPIGSTSDTLSDTLPGPTSTFGSGATADQQPSAGAESSTAEAGGTDTEITDSDLVAAEPSPVEPVPTAVEPVTNVVDPGPSVVASVKRLSALQQTLEPAGQSGAGAKLISTS